MIDLNTLTLPATLKDEFGDRIHVVAKMADGRFCAWYSLSSSTSQTVVYDAQVNGLKQIDHADDAYEWLHQRINSHILDAVKAFIASGRKINGIKFLRVIIPHEIGGYSHHNHLDDSPITMGLIDAKALYERIERDHA